MIATPTTRCFQIVSGDDIYKKLRNMSLNNNLSPCMQIVITLNPFDTLVGCEGNEVDGLPSWKFLMKIVSWNVQGLANPCQKSMVWKVRNEVPKIDTMCLQKVKIIEFFV
jgi:hypothetical protein